MSKNKIIYQGMELTSDKKIRSQILTLDPFYVLADMLLKSKKPYGIKPNRNIVLRTTSSSVSLGSIPIKDNNYMDILMRTEYIDNKELHSVYGITTEYKKTNLDEEECLEYGKNTSKFYQGPSYDSSLKEIREKLFNWSKGDILFAKVLSVMAASSPEHNFWNIDNPSKKYPGISQDIVYYYNP